MAKPKDEIPHTVDHMRVVGKFLYAQGFLTRDELTHIIASSNIMVNAHNKRVRALGQKTLFTGEKNDTSTGELSSGQDKSNATKPT